MTVSVVGLGLMGGSFALGLRESGFSNRLIGVESNPFHAQKALELGLVDQILSLEAAIPESHLILLATPVDQLLTIAPKVMDCIRPDQVVFDAGSTKHPVIQSIAGHSLRKQFVATHPMAGTEYSGPGAAQSGLFKGKCVVLCDTEENSPEALALVNAVYNALEMRQVYLESNAHDLHVAYVSHISHIASFALAITVLEKEKEEQRIFDLAGGGFSSTVRLAKSSPATWTPIFEQNSAHVLEVLDAFIQTTEIFRNKLIDKDFQGLSQMMEQANEIRRIVQ
jgi:prephenate dehydrogenase